MPKHTDVRTHAKQYVCTYVYTTKQILKSAVMKQISKKKIKKNIQYKLKRRVQMKSESDIIEALPQFKQTLQGHTIRFWIEREKKNNN